MADGQKKQQIDTRPEASNIGPELGASCHRRPFGGLPAPSQRRNDRRELDVGRRSTEFIELSRVQEHDAALAAGKELRFVPAAVLPHYADAVVALERADSAAPNAARYGDGRGHARIVVILAAPCPFRSIRGTTLDGRRVSVAQGALPSGAKIASQQLQAIGVKSFHGGRLRR